MRGGKRMQDQGWGETARLSPALSAIETTWPRVAAEESTWITMSAEDTSPDRINPEPIPWPEGIEGAVCLLLKQATEEAEEDLRTLLAKAQAAVRARQAMRAAIRDLHSEMNRAANRSIRKELGDALKDIQGSLSDATELSELTTLRLQMMMDRRSKFISTLSNILKKLSSTQDTLVQNLK